MGKVLNLYIEIDNITSEHSPSLLKSILIGAGYRIFDATEYDAYTSGFNRLDTIDEIKEDIVRKHIYEQPEEDDE